MAPAARWAPCCLAQPTAASAEVSADDFNALKDVVAKLSEQMQGLTQSNLLAQQLHEQDQQQIKALAGETGGDPANRQRRRTKKHGWPRRRRRSRRPGCRLDEATVNHNFQILGDAELQYANVDHQHGSFLLADFAPIFLYRGGDNVLFEAGFDTTHRATTRPNSSGYTTTFNLSFAQLDYVVNDYLTLCAGDLLLPLGTYTERGAGWLNKIPDNPLAVDALIPGSGVGAELRGAVPLGDAGKFFNYAVYGVNGPGSADGTGNAGALDLGGNVGVRSDGTTANLHNNPAGGGAAGGVFALQTAL